MAPLEPYAQKFLSSDFEHGEQKELAVLVTDIRNFTSLQEKFSPHETAEILNHFFETIGQIIDDDGGYISSYMGDGLMALFGLAPEVCGHPAALAVLTGLKIMETIGKFNLTLQEKYQIQIDVGVGIDFGPVLIGVLGYSKKKELMAIGTAASMAARIEDLTRGFNHPILVSENAYHKISHLFKWGEEYKARHKTSGEPFYVIEPRAAIERSYNHHFLNSPLA